MTRPANLSRDGLCVCQRPTSWHFDDQNRFVGCVEAERHAPTVADQLRATLAKRAGEGFAITEGRHA